MIDTHIHLNDKRFINQLATIINKANQVGVKQMIVSGYDRESSYKALEIANQYQGVYATVGIHPSEVDKFDEDDLLWITQLAQNPKVIAIGEVGLDYYWDKTFRIKQIAYFKKQIAIAKTLGLPIVVHSRDAIQDTFDCIKESQVSGVMHCYAGSYEMAKEFIKRGFLLGIGGVVTFKNAHIREVVERIDASYLLSETDAPYLAPVPFRGKTNYPEYIPIIVAEIAKIKHISIEDIIATMDENAKRIFNFERAKI